VRSLNVIHADPVSSLLQQPLTLRLERLLRLAKRRSGSTTTRKRVILLPDPDRRQAAQHAHDSRQAGFALVQTSISVDEQQLRERWRRVFLRGATGNFGAKFLEERDEGRGFSQREEGRDVRRGEDDWARERREKLLGGQTLS
jgi:hypothetical protein